MYSGVSTWRQHGVLLVVCCDPAASGCWTVNVTSSLSLTSRLYVHLAGIPHSYRMKLAWGSAQNPSWWHRSCAGNKTTSGPDAPCGLRHPSSYATSSTTVCPAAQTVLRCSLSNQHLSSPCLLHNRSDMPVHSNPQTSLWALHTCTR